MLFTTTLLPTSYSSKAFLEKGSQRNCPLFPTYLNRHSSPTHLPPASRSCYAAGWQEQGEGPSPEGRARRAASLRDLPPALGSTTPPPPAKIGTAPPFLFWGGRQGLADGSGPKETVIVTWEGEGGATLLPPLFPSLHPLQTPPTPSRGLPAPALVAKAQAVIPATASVM